MATEYNITQKQYNGTDYDTLYPQTTSQQVLLNDGTISYTGSATVNGALTKQQADITSLNSNIGNIRYAQYAVSGESSRSITLATWAVYLVSTFLGFHVVFTGSSSYTPVIETVRGNSSLPVTSEASATIVLGNTTGSTYQFSVIRIL